MSVFNENNLRLNFLAVIFTRNEHFGCIITELRLLLKMLTNFFGGQFARNDHFTVFSFYKISNILTSAENTFARKILIHKLLLSKYFWVGNWKYLRFKMECEICLEKRDLIVASCGNSFCFGIYIIVVYDRYRLSLYPTIKLIKLIYKNQIVWTSGGKRLYDLTRNLFARNVEQLSGSLICGGVSLKKYFT